MLENNELQFNNVVWVHPVLCSLANKVLLLSSCGRVALDWISSCANDIVEFGQFDNVRVVVILEEGLALETCGEDGFEDPTSVFLRSLAPIDIDKRDLTYVMLLDDLLEACIVQLRKLGQIVNICNDIAEIFLEQVKVLLY